MALLCGITNHDLYNVNAGPGERETWVVLDDTKVFLVEHTLQFLRRLKVTILDEALKAMNKVTGHIEYCGICGQNGCGKEFMGYVLQLTNWNKLLVHGFHSTELLKIFYKNCARSTSFILPQHWTIRCIYTIKVRGWWRSYLMSGGKTLVVLRITCRDHLVFLTYI